MRWKARLRQKDLATSSERGKRSRRCRDCASRQRVRQRPARESIPARASKAPQSQPRRLRECLHAGAVQPSANKEQLPRINESEIFAGITPWPEAKEIVGKGTKRRSRLSPRR